MGEFRNHTNVPERISPLRSQTPNNEAHPAHSRIMEIDQEKAYGSTT